MLPAFPGGPPEVETWVDPPPNFRVNFQAEAVLLKALRHPNVVACYGSVLVDTRRDGGGVGPPLGPPSSATADAECMFVVE